MSGSEGGSGPFGSPNIPPPPKPPVPETQPEPDRTVPEPTGEGVVREPYNQSNEF